MNNNIKGTGVALVTPFHPNGNIDFKSLDNLVQHIHNGGVDFIVALGTTAETATLNDDEKSAVLNTIIESNDGRLPIVVGMGSNDTRHLSHSIKTMDISGVDGILSVAPYYSKPNQKGIYFHFKEIALSTDLPIILYNVPGRTSSNILPETCLNLANDFSNIIGIKEASGDLMQVMEIIKSRKDGFKVLSGDDALTLPMIAAGSDGVISVVANAYPSAMSDMVNYMLSGKNNKKAADIQYQMLDIINALFADGNPGGIKALLEHIGIVGNNLRLPMVKVNRGVNNELKRLATEFKLK
jgi:4-hydroxy-tetrahydrodipicolinate synthase